MVTEPTELPVTVIWQPVCSPAGSPTVERVQVTGDGNVTLPFVPPVWEKLTASPEIVPFPPETLAVQDHERPISNWFRPPAVGGVQEREVVVAPWLTITLAVPELAALFESPGYDDRIVTEPAKPPVTVIWQIVPESAHVAGDGSVTVPPLPSGKVIVSRYRAHRP
jgi:hypothetical protein